MVASAETLREFAREMRRAPVLTERVLWRLLRDRRLDGLKFRRQVPLGSYIADFVCFQHRIIVEADGPRHDSEEAKAYDAQRDADLMDMGYRVIRFRNDEVMSNALHVFRTILAVVRAGGAGPSSDPAPRGHLLPQGEKET